MHKSVRALLTTRSTPDATEGRPLKFQRSIPTTSHTGELTADASQSRNRPPIPSKSELMPKTYPRPSSKDQHPPHESFRSSLLQIGSGLTADLNQQAAMSENALLNMRYEDKGVEGHEDEVSGGNLSPPMRFIHLHEQIKRRPTC